MNTFFRGRMIKYQPFVQALIPPISTLQHILVKYAIPVRFKVPHALTEQIETHFECLMLRHLSSPIRACHFFLRIQPTTILLNTEVR